MVESGDGSGGSAKKAKGWGKLKPKARDEADGDEPIANTEPAPKLGAGWGKTIHDKKTRESLSDSKYTVTQ